MRVCTDDRVIPTVAVVGGPELPVLPKTLRAKPFRT